MKRNNGLYWAALLVTGLGSLGLFIVSWFLGGQPDFGHPRFGYGYGMGFGHPMMAGFGWVIGLFVLLLIFGALFRGWRYRHGADERPRWVDPLADLAQAYAEGKITREEYRERKAVLEEPS